MVWKVRKSLRVRCGRKSEWEEESRGIGRMAVLSKVSRASSR